MRRQALFACVTLCTDCFFTSCVLKKIWEGQRLRTTDIMERLLYMHTHMYMYIQIHMYTCVCVYVSWCLFVVSCRVSRDVARNFLFVVRHQSLHFDCLSLCCALLSVLLRAVAVAFVGFSSLVEYLCLPQLSPLCCLICWLLAVSSVFFLSLPPPRPPSLSRHRV